MDTISLLSVSNRGDVGTLRVLCLVHLYEVGVYFRPTARVSFS